MPKLLKSKFIIAFAVVISLVVGYFAGRFHTSQHWKRVFVDFVRDEASNQTCFYVRALNQMRNGQQSNAVDFLEGCLDGELITFSGLEKLRLEDWDASALRAVSAIKVAKDYRAAYPYSGSPLLVSNAVQQVFTLSRACFDICSGDVVSAVVKQSTQPDHKAEIELTLTEDCDRRYAPFAKKNANHQIDLLANGSPLFEGIICPEKLGTNITAYIFTSVEDAKNLADSLSKK
jgi:hypothetical protein